MSNNFYFIRFGDLITQLLDFNHQISFKTIEENAYAWFHHVLPVANHIEFYSRKAKKFLVLNDDILKTDYNPFVINTSANDTTISSVHTYVELLVVDDSDIATASNTSSTMSCHNVVDEVDMSSSTMWTDQIELNGMENMSTVITGTSAPEDERRKDLISNDENKQIILRFTRDVQKYQKNNYLTNAFRVTPPVNNNVVVETKNGISCIQGVKNKDKERAHILPKIYGLQQFKNEPDMEMHIYAVYETVPIAGGDRIWYIHHDKKFLLPIELKRDAKPYNPIIFKLNEITLTKDGEFELNMYMLTKWEKLGYENEEVFYRLDETKTLQLHPALHQALPSKKQIPPVRLLILVEKKETTGSRTLKAIGLSGFIQPAIKSPKRNLSNNEEIDKQVSNKRKKT